MAAAEHSIRVFLSSPTDVTAERERAQEVVQACSAELESKGELRLEIVRWEEAWFTAAEHFQSQIPRPSHCDLVVCLFWKRLGTELPPAFARTDGALRTGTEWEFEEALEGAKASPKKTPDIFVYRKTAPIDGPTSELDRAQLRALEAFWQRWFRSEEGHFLAAFTPFGSTDDFAVAFRRHLERWLADRQGGGRWSIALQGSPFRGLAAFDEGHAAVFFGRRRSVEQARARLIAAAESKDGLPFLLILGMSGAGKSSLLRAGLVPRLMAPDVTPGIARWCRLVVTPATLGVDPFLGLARALLQADVLLQSGGGDAGGAEALANALRAAPDAAYGSIVAALDRWSNRLAGTAGHGAPPVTGLLFCIDQLEELFTWPETLRQSFLMLLHTLLRSGRVWVAATLRSDFYPLLQHEAGLLALKESGRSLDLTPPDKSQLAEIIEGPAAAAGLSYEVDPLSKDSLADRLLAEAVGANALPLLQFALHELYEARETETGQLRLDAYHSMGGLPGAIERRAEATLSALPADEQQALPDIIRALADPAEAGEDRPEVARLVPLEQFAQGTASRRLVEALIAARLLTATGDRHEADVRVAHEALFTHWTRARAILEATREERQLRRLIEQQAKAWSESEHNPEDLLRGGRLLRASELQARRPSDFSATQTFLAASGAAAAREGRRTRRRLTTVIASLSLLLVLACGAMIFAFEKSDESQSRMAVAEQSFSVATNTIDAVQTMFAQLVLQFGDVDPRKARELLTFIEQQIGQLLAAVPAHYATEEVLRVRGTFEFLMARNLVVLKDYPTAYAYADASVRDLRSLVGLKPDHAGYRRHLSLALEVHGDVLQAQGRLQDAEESYRESLILVQALAKTYPESRFLAVDVAAALGKLGDIRMALGDRDGAFDAYVESAAIWRRSFESEPRSVEYAFELIYTLYHAAGARAGSVLLLEEAMAVRQELEAKGIVPPDSLPSAADIEDALEDARAAAGVQ